MKAGAGAGRGEGVRGRGTRNRALAWPGSSVATPALMQEKTEWILLEKEMLTLCSFPK